MTTLFTACLDRMHVEPVVWLCTEDLLWALKSGACFAESFIFGLMCENEGSLFRDVEVHKQVHKLGNSQSDRREVYDRELIPHVVFRVFPWTLFRKPMFDEDDRDRVLGATICFVLPAFGQRDGNHHKEKNDVEASYKYVNIVPYILIWFVCVPLAFCGWYYLKIVNWKHVAIGY